MFLIEAAAEGVGHNVVKTGVAEHLCIHVTAPIPPEVKFPAILAERNPAAVTEDDGRDFPADRAGGGGVIYDDHGIWSNTSGTKPQDVLEEYFVIRNRLLFPQTSFHTYGRRHYILPFFLNNRHQLVVFDRIRPGKRQRRSL